MYYRIASASRRTVVGDLSTREYHLPQWEHPECGLVEAVLTWNLVGFTEDEPWMAEKDHFTPCVRCAGLELRRRMTYGLLARRKCQRIG